MIRRTDFREGATNSEMWRPHLRWEQQLLPKSGSAGLAQQKEMPEYFSSGDLVQYLTASPLEGSEEGLIALVGALLDQIRKDET